MEVGVSLFKVARCERITTDLADMFLNPFQSFKLILQTIIETGSLLDFFTRKEAVRSDAIIERDDDDVKVRGLDQARAIKIGI